ncbi:hypothetical protein N7462_005750 [Penicillium macrosclerotiorum]|uniref:uncharacterized protein n=1 Tax=Penicillium macrosclerotiorum TaxID=303699 RepID=UPI0025490AC5|nr:uncharacterized protein N7462_005750 [Penicillium macrosclerotiorum]KAJ5682585.1 hypothetical protein N7462_005750 [Penicillium macrosclerotiorum]
MSLFQKGLSAQVSAFAIRSRTVAPGVRSPLRRVRQPLRHKSSNASAPGAPVEGQTPGNGSAVNGGLPPKPSQSNPSSTTLSPSSAPTPSTSNSANPAATAAGAATTPAANTVVRSRGLREIIKAGPLGRVGRWYSRVQERKPYATQFWSSIVIYLCGDLSAQLLFPSEVPQSTQNQNEDGKEEAIQTVGYDPWRTARHLVVGAGSSIPSYNWFMFLHNNFNFSSKILSVLTKVVVQQICFTPVFSTYFFGVHSLLGGATLQETFERLKKALPVSITNSVMLWPAVTAFSFMYVPPQFRNVFSGVIAVGWQTYLSWLNQKAAREVLAEELAAKKLISSAPHEMAGKLITTAGTA